MDLKRVVDFNQKLVDDERKRMKDRGIALSDSLFFGSKGIERMRTPDAYKHVPMWKQNEYKSQAKSQVAASWQRPAFLERERKYVEDSTATARKALLGMKTDTPERKQRETEP